MPRRISVVLPCLVFLASPIFVFAGGYAFYDLGTLGGPPSWTRSYAYGVNDLGQVVGKTTLNGSSFYHAFVWQDQIGMQDLGILPEDSAGIRPMSSAAGINGAGQIAGVSDPTGISGRATVWDGSAGTAVSLGTLGGTWSKAGGINASGMVAGTSALPGRAGAQAFVWSPQTGMLDIDPRMQGFSGAGAINDQGHVAGYLQTDDNHNHAFLYTPETGMIDIHAAFAQNSTAGAVNEADMVAGSCTVQGVSHAFSWTAATGSTDLGTLAPGLNTFAEGINDRGDVVGFGVVISETYELMNHAFLYQDHRMIDLNSLVSLPAGYVLTDAASINNQGFIAGTMSVGGQEHAFFMTHAPEPLSGLLLLAGLLIGSRRRSLVS
jgi:probable HAF family extracellular repeat protein